MIWIWARIIISPRKRIQKSSSVRRRRAFTDDTASDTLAVLKLQKKCLLTLRSIRDKQFTICFANPSFKGTVDAESIHDNLKAVTNTKKTELLFLAYLSINKYKKVEYVAVKYPSTQEILAELRSLEKEVARKEKWKLHLY